MKTLAWILPVLAAIAFGGSLFVETRLAPMIGVVLLGLAIAYAMWMNKHDDESWRKAERAARRQNRERGRT
jgi:uncharacterized membrane protein YwaF